MNGKISEGKTNMSERALNSMLYIIEALKHHNYELDLVPITSELIILAKKANKNIKNTLNTKESKKNSRKK